MRSSCSVCCEHARAALSRTAKEFFSAQPVDVRAFTQSSRRTKHSGDDMSRVSRPFRDESWIRLQGAGVHTGRSHKRSRFGGNHCKIHLHHNRSNNSNLLRRVLLRMPLKALASACVMKDLPPSVFAASLSVCPPWWVTQQLVKFVQPIHRSRAAGMRSALTGGSTLAAFPLREFW